MDFFLLYLLIINASGLLSMLVDKCKAKKNLWRVPEATLLTIAVAGGSIGTLAGMYLFRHKTRHAKFYLGVPAIILLQIILAIFFF